MRRMRAKFPAVLTYAKVKWLSDPALATAMLLALSPLMLVIVVLIKLDSTGPILFRQWRYGHRGVPFQIYKFRTFKHAFSDPTGAMQVSEGDPRISKLGAVLRRTALDELPQLVNVVKGDMFLVGPRPHPLGMLVDNILCPDILPDYMHRYSVKPGITGWAQVNGVTGAVATVGELRQRLNYDFYYITNRSLRLDMMILCRTITFASVGRIFAAAEVDQHASRVRDVLVDVSSDCDVGSFGPTEGRATKPWRSEGQTST